MADIQQEGWEAYIHNWMEIKKQLATLSTMEKEMRNNLMALFINPPLEGTVNRTVGAYKLKVSFGLERKIDMTAYDALKNDAMWANVPNTIIRWKPELEAKVFKGLKGEPLLFVESLLTTKPKSPTVTVERVDG